MYTLNILGIFALLSPCLCQYGGQSHDNGQYNANAEQYNNYNRQPPPQILSHKQALNHDGNFKYLFTSENGLAQGETIAPDGSRNGGYSYVDPTGRKITVKYTAGKEGFRILEADHLPKAPLPVAPVPGAGLPIAQPQHQQPNYLQRPNDDGQYRPELYQKPQTPLVFPQQRYNIPVPVAVQGPSSNAINEKEPEYNDEPGKPYSFGNGYIFEFAG